MNNCAAQYNNEDVYKIDSVKIRKSIPDDSGTLLEINLEYPVISENDGNLSQVFNGFYSNIAENYCAYCEKKLVSKIRRQREHTGEGFKPFGEIMKFYVTRNCGKYLSVVTDITHFNGYFSNCTRFSCVWDTQRCRILPYSFFLNAAGKNVHEIRKEVRNLIYDEISGDNLQFGYTEGKVRRYASKVNPENYFLTDNGIAFWFPRGTLAPESEGFPAFIVKCDI